jgi:hypothetical protein
MEIAKLSIEKILADAKLIEAESKATSQQIENAVRLEESETSRANHSLDAAVKIAEVQDRAHAREMKDHDNAREHIRLDHEMTQSMKEKEND